MSQSFAKRAWPFWETSAFILSICNSIPYPCDSNNNGLPQPGFSEGEQVICGSIEEDLLRNFNKPTPNSLSHLLSANSAAHATLAAAKWPILNSRCPFEKATVINTARLFFLRPLTAHILRKVSLRLRPIHYIKLSGISRTDPAEPGIKRGAKVELL
ncbi:hypothetical protein chiPu_0016930 [Chiloscyllium punctatum]|uniref:Uncharacterized protein n=1 Tax=Chiloscyllium punctatum TaxID=137246 RepID=A0A401T6X7_CHIPU|nr:hypothetical protein [Chiloscyllium punctatum]